jgi:hypothetical protein
MTVPGEGMDAPLVRVRLIGLPVAVWARAQEHVDGLLREFTLLAAGSRGTEAHVPAALLELVQEIQQQYDGVTTDQELELDRAAAADTTSLDLTYMVPPSAADACVRLGEMLDAADRYCQAGEHLLTLATPTESVAFRRWYLDEFIGQIAGRPAMSWPQWVASGGKG